MRTLREAEIRRVQEKIQRIEPRSQWFRQRMGDHRPFPEGRDIIGIPANEWIAWENLERLGCVWNTHGSSARAGGLLTAFGEALLQACYD